MCFIDRERTQRGVRYLFHCGDSDISSGDTSEDAPSGSSDDTDFVIPKISGVALGATPYTLLKTKENNICADSTFGSSPRAAAEGEKQPTSSEPPKLELTPPLAEVKPKAKASATGRTKRKSTKASKTKVVADPTVAERVIAMYAEIVKPKRLDNSGSRKIFLATAARLLSEGVTEADMAQAMRNYSAIRVGEERKEKDPEAQIKFRFGFQTFFGPQNEHWRDYVAMDTSSEEGAVSGPQGNLDNLADRVNDVAARYGDDIGRRYDAKAREKKSTAAADKWLSEAVRREGVA